MSEKARTAKEPMYLECVTVCVDYGDYLAETARKNQHHFDHMVVVTSKADAETFGICRDYSIDCVVTDDFYRDGPKTFNKGRGINRGLNRCSCAGWVLHIDADIVLPRTFRQMLESAHLDETCLYGADRLMVRDWATWQQTASSGLHQSGRHCYVQPDQRLPMGTRWASPRDGYVPIGFFQLFHGPEILKDGFLCKGYPLHHSDAARSDVQFGLQWDRRHRLLLPEVIVWHLEGSPNKLGSNWDGRTTPRFGPPGK